MSDLPIIAEQNLPSVRFFTRQQGTWAGFRPSWDRLVLPYWWLVIAIVILLSTREIVGSDIERSVVRSYHPRGSMPEHAVKGGNDISRNLVSRNAKNNVILLGGRSSGRPSHGVNTGCDLGISPIVGPASSGRSWGFHKFDFETRNRLYSVYDLGTWEILRSEVTW